MTTWTEDREFCVLLRGAPVMYTVEEQAAIDHMISLNQVRSDSAVIKSRRVLYGPWEDW